MIACGLCGTPHMAEERCPECGMTSELGPTRPNPFRGATLWMLIGAVLVVYLVTLLVVVLAR